MVVIVWVIISIVVMSALTRAVVYAPKHAQWGVVAALMVAVTALGLIAPERLPAGFFGVIKFFSVAAYSILAIGMRYHGWAERSWSRVLWVLLLVLNMGEAVSFETYDWFAGGPTHSMGGNLPNALAGILLLVALPGPSSVRVQGERADVRYPVGALWMWAYTLWDFVFVYGTNPPDRPTGEWAALAVVHLLVPIVAAKGRAEDYMQSRAYSLMMISALGLLYPHPPLMYTSPDWHARPVAEVLALISLAIAAATVVLAFKKRRAAAAATASDAEG